MKILNTLSPRILKCYLFNNIFKTAGFRYNLLLVILLFFTQMSLNAQSMFEIENQSPCNWDIELFVANTYSCNYFTPVISAVAMPNMTTQVNIPNTYPCTSCSVNKVRVYNQGGSGNYIEIGYYGCKPQKLNIGDCPIDGLVYLIRYDNPQHVTIAIK